MEITDINEIYLQNNELNVEVFERGFAWLDTGTPPSLMQASNFVEAIEQRQGIKIGCVEEIAFEQGFIAEAKLQESATKLHKSDYGKYLQRLVERAALLGQRRLGNQHLAHQVHQPVDAGDLHPEGFRVIPLGG